MVSDYRFEELRKMQTSYTDVRVINIEMIGETGVEKNPQEKSKNPLPQNHF